MTDLTVLQQKLAEKTIRCELRFNELMSKHTSFRIGGPAEVMAFPKSREELREILQLSALLDAKVAIVGAGTNILAPDAGLSGIVSFIAPTFGDEETTGGAESSDTKNDEFYVSVLDDIGSLIDTEIEGIPGLGLIDNLENGDDSYITFE
jgi:hypothetical protein